MLENKSVFLSAVYSLVAAIVGSFIFSSLFGKWYVYIFKPIKTCGLSGLDCLPALITIQNAIFAYLFFLPLFILIFVPRKQWLVWLILIFIPFTMVLVNGSKYLIWFFIFTIAGGLIGWLINLAIKKLKK
ncbi:MAG: hypothetical protein AUJ11_02525 [Parcubacteria group bacterium CG1_02_44_65]|nr:MAG: hypothetical protein AUJ11_02525 [Parcubacteria group bacterium CG1_02_44_65]